MTFKYSGTLFRSVRPLQINSLHSLRRIIASVAIGGVLFNTQSALAADVVRLEEVLVSASKKTESLQDTPISLTVFNQERLTVEGISGLKDIASKVPGLTIEPFPINGGSLRIYIRGIGIGDIQVTQDTPVGLYLDGVYIARSSGTSMDVAELARIEILRGPQGTLYGRNTTGGAINLVTRRPNVDEVEFSQIVSAGDRALFRSKTSLNLPITDSLAVKFAYLTESRDGFVDNTGPGGDFGDREIQGARFDLGWDISERLRLDYSYDRSELESYNYTFQAVTPPDPNGNKGQSNAIKNSTQARSRFSENMLGSLATTAPLEASNSDVEGHALILSTDTGFGLFKYIGSYRELTDAAYTDLGGGLGSPDYRLDTNRYDGPAAQFANGGETPLVRPEVRQDQSSHELQFSDAVDDWGIEYVVGAYYFEESAVEDNSPFHLQLTAPIDGFEDAHIVNLVSQKYEIENQALAVFGQLTWTPDIFDKALHLTVGARHSRDHRYALKNQRDEVFIEYSPVAGQPFVLPLAELAQNPVLGPALAPIFIEAGLPGDRRFDDASGERRSKDDSFSFVTEYEINDDINVYGKFVEAYKSGGFNTRDPQLDGNQGAASDGTDYGVGFADGFGEEKAVTAELGIKSEWLNGRLRINADVYQTRFDDMQINFLLNGTIADTKVLNAGKAKMSGFEFDARALVGDDIIVSMEYAYIDAEITEVIDSFGNNVTQRYAFSAAPVNSYTASAEWIAWRGESALVQVNINTSYMDTRLGGGDVQKAFTVLRDYQLWNARVSLDDIGFASGKVSVSLWGKNLLDTEYETYAIDNLPHADRAVLWGEPLSYGIDIAYRY
jgi:iron complex outermembrane receptor protein